MNQASFAAFRYLIERVPKEKQTAFDRYLSEEMRARLSKSYSLEENPFETLLPLSAQLRAIHYSWFVPFLTPLSTNDKNCFITAFDSPVDAKLRAHFTIDDSPPSLSLLAKRYLHTTLFSWALTDTQDFTPVCLLPSHPLNKLLNLKKRELQQLADLLGLRDLATEIKHIVRREQIKRIKATLSQQEAKVLKKLLSSPPPPLFPSLNLEQWDGNETVLKNILHHRGFNRLSKALFGCHPALLWHLCHRLDTGRAKIVHRFFTDVKKPSLKEALINQAVEAVAIIRENHE